ncbi:zinc finger BED domain-containing protein RICESLEEPER 2-like [Pyrus communis]|uniref:zinc finger BED domain-containing protein RICESLEEPER 2-like n=1 Tax=Pyrus communis TaxID=23211 RepID=UPI0035C159B9
MPFRVVDQEDFRDFIRDLNPKYKLPNRHKVVATVLELYVEKNAKIKSVIEGLRVSITTDTWTSIQMINYMVITAPFLDTNWGLHKRILNFVQVISHKGDDIGRCLEVCLNDWGIDKVFSITVDNASANDTAIAYMKKRLKSNGTLLLDGAHLHMRMSSIPFDVVTRWNATYEMLNSAFKFKEVFSKMAFKCDSFIAYFKEEVSKEVDGVTTKAKRVGSPEVDDWERSMSFAHFLKKFYDATLTLRATLTPTSHLILSTVIALQVEIQEQILNTSNATLQSVATSMKLKFDKYWGYIENVNPILFVAQALDPRYKFDMLETNLEELGYGWDKIREEKVRVKGYVTELYNAYKKGVVFSSSTSSTSSSATSNVEQRSSVVLDDVGGVIVDIDVASKMTKKIQRKKQRHIKMR